MARKLKQTKAAIAARRRYRASKKGGTKKGQVRKTARRAYVKKGKSGRRKGACTTKWTRYRKKNGRFARKGSTRKTEQAWCPDTRTV